MEYSYFSTLAANLLNPRRGNLPNLYIYGPPGTSKTFYISKLKKEINGTEDEDFIYSNGQILSNDLERPMHWKNLIGDREAKFWWLTFHQGISYEDFVLGLRPIPDGTGLKLQPRAGPLLEAAEWAKDGGASFVIIDEMNRGDLPRILGDFITFMEYGNREGSDNNLTFANLNMNPVNPLESEDIIFPDGERKINLNDGGYDIPKHLYLLGTMNSLDRSVAPIDSAIERRFNRIPLVANPQSLLQAEWPIPESLKVIAIKVLERMNSTINEKVKHYPEESHLGQAILGTSSNAAALKYAVNFRLLPQFKKVLGTNMDDYYKFLAEIEIYKQTIDIGNGERLP
jgi:5-methylcytosine-specific restriction endonuclease McrBC GTP-binding regulatory subunit McrB